MPSVYEFGSPVVYSYDSRVGMYDHECVSFIANEVTI